MLFIKRNSNYQLDYLPHFHHVSFRMKKKKKKKEKEKEKEKVFTVRNIFIYDNNKDRL